MRTLVTTKQEHSTTTRNMDGIAKKESLVWTDDEVQLLLRVILDYKLAKLKEDTDWESCHTKYSDIFHAFQAQYPTRLSDVDFPHYPKAISKAQVTAKVKTIRGKYRQAVYSGDHSRQGRVMLLFYDICKEIWDSEAGGNLNDSSSGRSSAAAAAAAAVERSADSPCSVESHESHPPAAAYRRTDAPQVLPKSNRAERSKRRYAVDPAVLEDIKLKRRMLLLMEESSKRNAENMQQINKNIANIACGIQEGFSLMRRLLVQPPQLLHPQSSSDSSSGGFGQLIQPNSPTPADPGTPHQTIKVEVVEKHETF